MGRADYEKTKLKWIIKTYIHLQGEATANEIYNFLQEHDYHFITPLPPQKIGKVMQDTKQGVLQGLKKEKRYRQELEATVNVYYY